LFTLAVLHRYTPIRLCLIEMGLYNKAKVENRGEYFNNVSAVDDVAHDTNVLA